MSEAKQAEERPVSTSVLLRPAERRQLVELAAQRSVDEGRPVSCSSVVRELIAAARRTQGPGPRRVA